MAASSQAITEPGAWQEAFAAARAGRVEAVREICDALKAKPPAFAGAHEYLLGRCLAEAGRDLDESIDLLDRAQKADANNALTPFALALAYLRSGRADQAAQIFKKRNLPHDETLLAHVTLELEMSLRPWPERAPADWPAWPPQLGPDPSEATSPAQAAEEPLEGQAPKLTWGQRRALGAVVARLEDHYHAHRMVELESEVAAALEKNLDGADLQLIAGIACEEAGDAPRARAHLARALAMEPTQLMARTFLGRVYWRNGWHDLAESLWRSLPVEGPDDFGRHYHLALAHESAGRRVEALQCFHIAVRDFFIETREFYIQRIFERWLVANGGEPEDSP